MIKEESGVVTQPSEKWEEYVPKLSKALGLTSPEDMEKVSSIGAKALFMEENECEIHIIHSNGYATCVNLWYSKCCLTCRIILRFHRLRTPHKIKTLFGSVEWHWKERNDSSVRAQLQYCP